MIDKSVSLVIGGYNESAILENSLKRVYEAMDGNFAEWELILVDDASKDKTADIMDQFAYERPNVRVIKNYVNLNFGTAVLRGIYAAKYDYVSYNACDLPLAPEDFVEFMRCLDDNYDAVVFERQNYITTKWRGITSVVNGLLLKILFPKLTKGTPILNYVHIYKRSILPSIMPLARSPIFVWPEMVFRAKYKNYKVVSIPAECRVENLRKGAFGHPHDIIWGIYEMLRFRIRLWGGKI